MLSPKVSVASDESGKAHPLIKSVAAFSNAESIQIIDQKYSDESSSSDDSFIFNDKDRNVNFVHLCRERSVMKSKKKKKKGGDKNLVNGLTDGDLKVSTAWLLYEKKIVATIRKAFRIKNKALTVLPFSDKNDAIPEKNVSNTELAKLYDADSKNEDTTNKTSSITPLSGANKEHLLMAIGTVAVFGDIQSMQQKKGMTGIQDRLNPYIYEINIKHGNFEWTVFRKFKDFRNIHDKVVLIKTKNKLNFKKRFEQSILGGSVADKNMKPSTKMESDMKEPSRFTLFMKQGKSTNKIHIPPFPTRPEIFIGSDKLPERMMKLQNYLQAIVNLEILKKNISFYRFLEISPVSFIYSLGKKMKEGFVYKHKNLRAKEDFKEKKLLRKIPSPYQKRWFFLKETFIGYFRLPHWEIADIFLFDNNTTVTKREIKRGGDWVIVIRNNCRLIVFACKNPQQLDEWYVSLHNAIHSVDNHFHVKNRFDSFAPLRQNGFAKWYSDGHGYFNDLANALVEAKEEIFITDWWLSPQYHLKRPYVDNNWRLDVLLKKMADQGVRIYILLYKEVTFCLGINSFYTKTVLKDAHPNIQVIRHPDHLPGGILLWAHHEKMCCIDQTICFMGGLDICLGRWDVPSHPIFDSRSSLKSFFHWPLDARWMLPNLIEYQIRKQKRNLRKKMGKPKIKKRLVRKIPVPQISIRQENFEIYKNLADEEFIKPKTISLILRDCDVNENTDSQISGVNKKKEFNFRMESDLKFKSCCTKKRKARTSNQSNRTKSTLSKHDEKSENFEMSRVFSLVAETDFGMNDKDDRSHFTSIRQKIYSEYEVDAMEAQKLDEKFKHLKADHRTRLQQGEDTVWPGKDYVNWIYKDVVDVQKFEEDYINRSCIPRMPWHDIACVVLGKTARDFARHFIQRWNAAKLEKEKSASTIPFLMPKTYEKSYITPEMRRLYGLVDVNLQVVRSSSRWSANLRTTENSIYNAYVSTIKSAKYYIYIENQFFISSSVKDSDVENQVALAIMERVVTAHQNKENFRVYIVVPLLPAFADDPAIFAVSHYFFRSLWRGDSSLFAKLRQNGVENPTDYISINGLRTYAKFNDKLYTEMIYVHSKLMIVDDRFVLMGSANINDRSLNGGRDSELAVIIEDKKFSKGILGGKTCEEIGFFACSLRVALMREHLGVPWQYKLMKECLLRESHLLDPHIFNTNKEETNINSSEGKDNTISSQSDTTTNRKSSGKKKRFRLDWNYALLGDPADKQFFEGVWKKTAKQNTAIFEKVFNCIPSNTVETFQDLNFRRSDKNFAEKSPIESEKLLTHIRGALVEYPHKFLEKEVLEPKVGSKESFLPYQVWC